MCIYNFWRFVYENDLNVSCVIIDFFKIEWKVSWVYNFIKYLLKIIEKMWCL